MLNTGLFDAKGLHHPVVTALQLGRKYPRNKVVGWAWHHAHEWMRANMSTVVFKLKAAQRLDLSVRFGLTPDCFDESASVQLDNPLWTEEFDTLGTAHHAFPRIKFTIPSFSRTLDDRHYLFATTDGDLQMWRHLCEGLGDGDVMRQRGGDEKDIDGCSYHKLASLKKMVNLSMRILKTLRSADPDKWDRQHSAGHLLETQCDMFHRFFGDYIDDVMQHDAYEVGLVMWELVLELATLIGGDSAKWNKYYHPETGENGTWGRMMRTYEAATGVQVTDHPLARIVSGTVRIPMKGTVPSANGLEGNINNKTASDLECSTAFKHLMTKLRGTWNNMSRDCIGQAGFSVLPDYFGKNKGTTHTRKAGRGKKAKTSRNMPKVFRDGVDMAHQGQDYPGRFHKVGTGDGTEAEYIVASDLCIKTVHRMYAHDNPCCKEGPSLKWVQDTIKLLRDDWINFMKNPKANVEALRAYALKMNLTEARRHMLDPKWPRDGKRFRHTPYQVHAIVAAGAQFNCGAFHRVLPRKHLSQEQARPHLQEGFRHFSLKDPWDTDVGVMQCLHCDQYSKTGYCSHVAAVTVLEGIIHDLPRRFACHSVEDGANVRSYRIPTATTRYKVPKVLSSPQKNSPSQMPYARKRPQQFTCNKPRGKQDGKPRVQQDGNCKRRR